MFSKDVLDTLTGLGRSQANPITLPGGDPLLVIPAGYQVSDISKYLPPARIKQAITLLDSSSFIDYVNRYKAGDTVIFVEVTDTGATFKAVIDYHHPDRKAAYCSHVAVYTTAPTIEWKEFMEGDDERRSQVDFATWLEDHAELFTAPKGADLLELVKNLVGKSDVNFKSAIRLESGANKLVYDEDVTVQAITSSRKGELQLPKTLEVGVAPFEGSAAYKIKARFKYRIDSGKLVLWYEVINPHLVVRTAIGDIVKEVNAETDILPFIGKL